MAKKVIKSKGYVSHILINLGGLYITCNIIWASINFVRKVMIDIISLETESDPRSFPYKALDIGVQMSVSGKIFTTEPGDW